MLSEKDFSVFTSILELSKEPWFFDGLDSPEDLADRFSDVEVENEDLHELLQLTTSGPDSTDIWLETHELQADVVRDGSLEVEGEITYDEMWESNRLYFGDKRYFLLEEIKSSL